MKNNSDKKFSYQQLPVSLKLIYTILQVLGLNNCISNQRLEAFKNVSFDLFECICVTLRVTHVFCIFRKCQSLRSLIFCSTCWTAWRSCVFTESVYTSPVRITRSFWLTSRRRCSSLGVSREHAEKTLNSCMHSFTAFNCANSLSDICASVSSVFSLWSMLKSEFCQLASLAVPQLLHALSLSHGADIFWNLINTNFNSKDWKIRFEAGESK